MVDNTYAVPPNFPVGVLMSQLKQELVGVWPGDVFPLTMLSRTKPGAGGVVTSGSIVISTQRVLTAPEDAAALAFFPTHVPVLGAGGGVTAANLIAGIYQGEQVFVSDEPRQGGGVGVVCYWDGLDRTWRRIRDDVAVATIP